MKYDPQTPIAVFLGPSLALQKAERLLSANYYPPVRMGDVYRLLATGVKTIIIIDGVFHNITPVWQRELIAAMDRGITVIGACSMGALRAAELDRLGMVGYGQIYEWYRDGTIDGDDEVALLHADEALGYQAISEPMVNIRYNLALAVQRSVLTPSEASTLINLAKNRYFGERSYHLLLQSSLVLTFPPPQRTALTDLLTEHPVNLKQEDAAGVLRYCAGLGERKPSPSVEPALSFPRPVVETAYPAHETVKRGLWTPEGRLVEIGKIFDEIKTDAALMASEQARCAANFYLGKVVVAFNLTVSPEYLERFQSMWTQKHVVGDTADWLRQVGLTHDEFDRLVQARALRSFLVSQTPESLGLDFSDQRIAIEALAQWYSRDAAGGFDRSAALAQNRLELTARAVAGSLVTNWAYRRGIHVPHPVVDDFIECWEQREVISSRGELLKALGLTQTQYRAVWSQQAMYQWMIEKSPQYFGYDTYSFFKELMEDMQVTGLVRSLSQKNEKDIA